MCTPVGVKRERERERERERKRKREREREEEGAELPKNSDLLDKK